MNFVNSIEFALQEDDQDKLRKFQSKFLFPEIGGKKAVYLCGNSLGLQPVTVKDAVLQELDDWAKLGVEGHMKARSPWLSYHEQFSEPVARIVGALPNEIVVMNQLTVNLHLLMASFYRPSKERYKIICEAKAFPSDQYALESQVRFHGFNPEDAIIEVKPRDGEYLIRNEDIISSIEKAGDSLALVMIGGVNYYTGQVFDMEQITESAHKVGAYAGFDLAHATGNIKLNLHAWKVDFACWCSYKYLNSGPGGVSGVYIYEKHARNKNLTRFAGWWGHDKKTRFLMGKNFVPIESAEGWQLSNAPVLSMAAHKASISIFEEAGMDNLIQKSKKMTAYLEFIIEDINRKITNGGKLEIITPKDEKARGCQISIVAHNRGKELFNVISENGIIADWREPNVIRIAPVPLYNSFEDLWKFGQIISSCL
ncbi:MAG: kynureninase [Bacteroidetes bacterium]|nr:kynureninase [Bacteroidota bacterium]HET6243303.1 kynureninase [Bacteroidia bacterium]